MWNIKIGMHRSQGCSATLCRDLGEGYSISHNSESYWISERFLDLGLMIGKGTPEYVQLTKLLADGSDDSTIRMWIDKLVRHHATIQQLQAAINNKVQEAYRNGRRDAKDEIRAVLLSD